MSAIKRFAIIILIILFMLSLIDDLSKREPDVDNDPARTIQAETEIETGIAHIKIKPGDTILSVTEQLNQLDDLNVQQIIDDFEQLNPGTDIDSLIPHSFYYFPLYNEQ